MDIYQRDYLRWFRDCRAHFAAHPRGTVVLGYEGIGRPLTRQQWNAYVVANINARVAPVPESMGDTRHPDIANWRVRGMRPWRNWDDLTHWDFYRDQQALHNRLFRRIRVYQFNTATVRRRYGHLLACYEDD